MKLTRWFGDVEVMVERNLVGDVTFEAKLGAVYERGLVTNYNQAKGNLKQAGQDLIDAAKWLEHMRSNETWRAITG